MRLAYEFAPKIGNSLSRQTLDGDARYYQRLAGTGAAGAAAAAASRAGATTRTSLYFGGNSEMRGYDYLEFVGQNAVFANAELRFPLIEAMLTPIGVIGGIRGVFFVNIGGGWFDNSGYQVRHEQHRAVHAAPGRRRATRTATTSSMRTATRSRSTAPAQTISGFRLRDGRASYGVGLETFALGFPIHFDWSWRTLFNHSWENALFATQGDLTNGTNFGGEAWRKSRFAVWIGYDF